MGSSIMLEFLSHLSCQIYHEAYIKCKVRWSISVILFLIFVFVSFACAIGICCVSAYSIESFLQSLCLNIVNLFGHYFLFKWLFEIFLFSFRRKWTYCWCFESAGHCKIYNWLNKLYYLYINQIIFLIS